MRKLCFAVLTLSVLSVAACHSTKNDINATAAMENAAKNESPAHLNRKSKQYAVNSKGDKMRMEGNAWFSFFLPEDWTVSSDADSDNEYKVYEFKILPPSSSPKLQSVIYLSYYAENNEDISTYQEFIRVNSQNILRRGQTVGWEKYEPVSEKSVAGRKAFVVARNCRHFLHPNSKDDSFVMKKEKMYVMPAKKGYYVIRYGADEYYFGNSIAAFEDIAESFQGLY